MAGSVPACSLGGGNGRSRVSAPRSSGSRTSPRAPPAVRPSADRRWGPEAPSRRCAFPARLPHPCGLAAPAASFWPPPWQPRPAPPWSSWHARLPARRRYERRVLLRFRRHLGMGAAQDDRLALRRLCLRLRAAEHVADKARDCFRLFRRRFAFLGLRRRLRHRHARHRHGLARRGRRTDCAAIGVRGNAPGAVATWMRRPLLS